MGSPIHVKSTAEWTALLSGTTVVVADFYADWCGPCKMIAPHFERLAKEHSRPKKVAFAKVNVDEQSDISRMNSVRAMPTFKIFHNGACVETIQGANPSALTSAVAKAVQLSAGGKADDLFKSPGRTLGTGRQDSGLRWSMSKLVNAAILLVGLYLASLFSARNKKEIDAYKGAESSIFNPNRAQKRATPAPASAPNKNGPSQAQQHRPNGVRTLADL